MYQSITRTLPKLFLWQAVSVITGFISQIILARTLGPRDKGIVDLFLLVPLILSSILDFGLLSANTYFAGKKTLSLDVLHSNSFLWTCALGLISLVSAFCLITFLGSPFPSLSKTLFLLSVGLAIPSLYFSLWSGLMYGINQVSKVYSIAAITSVFSLAGYVAIAATGASLDLVLWLSAFFLSLKAGISFWILRKTGSNLNQVDTDALKQSLRYGFALYLGFAINAIHFRVDQFLINSMLGPSALGYYALSVRIAELIWLLDYVVVGASLYRVTSSELSEAAMVARRSVKFVGVLVSLPACLIFITAPFVIPLFFGPAFEPSTLPLQLILPGVICWSLSRSLGPFIAYQCGKPWYNTLSAGLALLTNVGANLILIPRFGIVGASVASTLSYTVNLFLIARFFLQFSGSTIRQTFVPTPEEFWIVLNYLKQKYPFSLINR